MNRILDTLIPTALVALFFASAAQAQPGHTGGLLEGADANKDGSVSREELAAVDVFSLLDKNSDGKIDRSDFMPVFKMRADGGFLLQLADEDKDGKLTKADWQSFLSKADANGDGQLSHSELRSFLPAPPTAPEAPRAPRAPRGAAAPPTPPMPPLPPVPPMDLSISDLVGSFDRFDANKDGELSGDELPQMTWHARHHLAPPAPGEASESDG